MNMSASLLAAAPPRSAIADRAASSSPANAAARPANVAADGIRAVGAGLATGSEMLGVSSDKAFIHPVEGFYATGKAARNLTAGVPVLEKVGGGVGKVFSAGGFVAAFQGMILGGLLRSPGSVAQDIGNGAADRIDGGDSLNREGFSMPVPGHTGPTARIRTDW